MKSIECPTFGRLEMSHEIPEINMYWWTGVIRFPNTNTKVTIEIHATPVGPSEIQKLAYSRLQSGYHALIQSATAFDRERLTLHNWELAQIVLFANGHMDLRFKCDNEEYCIHADQDALFLTPTEAEHC